MLKNFLNISILKNENNLQKFAARVVSYIFIPPIMNFVIFFIYSSEFENKHNFYYSIFLSLILGLLLPITIFIFLRKRGKIENDDATVKEERTIPYLYGILLTLIGVIVSGLMQFNKNIIMLWLVYLICSIILTNINKSWKISAHTMGVAIPLGASFFINQGMFIIFIFILLSIIWARFKLKVHDLYQLLAGSIIGFFITFVMFKYCLCL